MGGGASNTVTHLSDKMYQYAWYQLIYVTRYNFAEITTWTYYQELYALSAKQDN